MWPARTPRARKQRVVQICKTPLNIRGWLAHLPYRGPMRNIGFLGRWSTYACPQCLPSGSVPIRSIRAFVSLLCGRQVANRRCVNSMCTLSYDKVHTVYHGHSRVTLGFHGLPPHSIACIPKGDTFRSIPISKNVLNSKDTRSFAKSGRNLGNNNGATGLLRLKCKFDLGFQCKASHSVRLMGPTWASR